MGKKTPINVSVKLGGRIRTTDQLIRKFLKQCKDERIVQEVKERTHFISKAQRRRMKKHVGKMRHLRTDLKKGS